MIYSTDNVSRQTVSTWFSKWEESGICRLIDILGRGRPSLLTEVSEDMIWLSIHREHINGITQSLEIVKS